MKLSGESLRNNARLRGWDWVLEILCFAILSFSIRLIGQPRVSVPVAPQTTPQSSVTAASSPKLFPLP